MKKENQGTVICSLEELCFPVVINDNPRKTNREYSKVITGIIDEEEMDLNYCSPVYQLVENKEIFPNIENVLNINKIEFEVSYKHINYVRFYADYVITDSRYAYKMNNTNDVIQPMIRVQHSYNGLTKYRIIFGYFRLVCTNGLTVPIEEMEEFNLCIVGKHTDSIKHSFVELNEMLRYFASDALLITGTIVGKFELLGSKWTDKPMERIEEILTANKIIMIDTSKFNTLNDIMERIMYEANMPNLGYNGRVNDWLIYNGINSYICDDSRNIVAPELRIEKDQKVLEYMLTH